MVRIAGIAGQPLELSWLAGVSIPGGVSIEVADFDTRVDLVAASDDSQVAVVLDVPTGALLLQERTGPNDKLEKLVDEIVVRRTAAGVREGSAVESSTGRILFERVNWPRQSSPGQSMSSDE